MHRRSFRIRECGPQHPLGLLLVPAFVQMCPDRSGEMSACVVRTRTRLTSDSFLAPLPASFSWYDFHYMYVFSPTGYLELMGIHPEWNARQHRYAPLGRNWWQLDFLMVDDGPGRS